MIYNALKKEFYLNDTLTVAESLIGKYIIRKIGDDYVVGRINEVEAYIGRIDKACHAYNYKMTERSKTLFHEGGVAYVYFIYGMYFCLNAVTEAEGEPCAVLIRGADIIYGKDKASLLRYGRNFCELNKSQIKNMSNGPGKLCVAMSINKSDNCSSLSEGGLIIAENIEGIEDVTLQINKTKRVGIDYAEEAIDFLWRFVGTYD